LQVQRRQLAAAEQNLIAVGKTLDSDAADVEFRKTEYDRADMLMKKGAGTIEVRDQRPLLRGFYYDGWHPHVHKLASRDAFLERVRDALKHDMAVDAEQVVRAVLALLARRIRAVEIEDAKAATPPAIHGLWPA
jgi:uncharacterized protein (DUF2267 family)